MSRIQEISSPHKAGIACLAGAGAGGGIEVELLGGAGNGSDDSGFGIWMGRSFLKVLGRACCYVVALKHCSCVFIQIVASQIRSQKYLDMTETCRKLTSIFGYFPYKRPPGVGRRRGRGREDNSKAKSIGHGLDDGAAKGGRGRGGNIGKVYI